MAAGILSVGFRLAGQGVLSSLLLGVATIAWLFVSSALLALGLRGRPGALSARVGPRSLTAVAASSVLGVRCAELGWSWAAGTLLLVAFVVFVSILPAVLAHWQRPAGGASFLLPVAVESLALLASSLAIQVRAPWLALAGAGLLVVGVSAYLVVLLGFDPHQLAAGYGDQWIAGGALALAALAGTKTAMASQALEPLLPAGAIEGAALGLWMLALAWLPALVLGEARAPRRRGYASERWATVFPLAMYAVSTLQLGKLERLDALVDLGGCLIWVGLAAWLFTTIGLTRQVASTLRLRAVFDGRATSPYPAARPPARCNTSHTRFRS